LARAGGEGRGEEAAGGSQRVRGLGRQGSLEGHEEAAGGGRGLRGRGRQGSWEDPEEVAGVEVARDYGGGADRPLGRAPKRRLEVARDYVGGADGSLGRAPKRRLEWRWPTITRALPTGLLGGAAEAWMDGEAVAPWRPPGRPPAPGGGSLPDRGLGWSRNFIGVPDGPGTSSWSRLVPERPRGPRWSRSVLGWGAAGRSRRLSKGAI
jgi:hypothetical protein